MQPSPLPLRADLLAYQQQADELLSGWTRAEAWAIEVFKTKHPRFLDDIIPWLSKRLSDEEARRETLNVDDARLALARAYDFRDWASLQNYVDAVSHPDSETARFESAVEATIDGDVTALSRLLRADPGLVRARSTRVTPFDPPVHRATLLHYLGANGVEGYRQRSPENAVDVARLLLDGGADVDALASMYGGECTTMSMLVSSTPPAEAGVQVPLIDVLVDSGASVEARGKGAWTSPLMTALVFCFREAAEALVRRGAKINTLAAASGLGRIEDARRLLADAGGADRHRAMALAAQFGHTAIVALLLDAGEDPNRYNPEGTHAHATPLHHAALGGHDAVVRLLVDRGAQLDIRDTIYQATPLGWAEHNGQKATPASCRLGASIATALMLRARLDRRARSNAGRCLTARGAHAGPARLTALRSKLRWSRSRTSHHTADIPDAIQLLDG